MRGREKERVEKGIIEIDKKKKNKGWGGYWRWLECVFWEGNKYFLLFVKLQVIISFFRN
jgi:hypothetical protein